MKIAAIVPALNEEKNIGNVLKTLLESEDLDEVILVDDGSTDKTAEIGEKLGAKVVRLPTIGGSGKANAMREGIMVTDAEIIVFFDADLIGFTQEHISSVVGPVIKGEAEMCVGIRDRHGSLPKIIVKIDPLLAIGGERAMKRYVFEAIPKRFMQGFTVETALNYYCRANKLAVKYAELKSLDVVTKEKKWGFLKGFKSRIRMIWQMIKIRILIVTNKKEFIK
jgi:glycosyltransferase involved in cell wall biosynthesis